MESSKTVQEFVNIDKDLQTVCTGHFRCEYKYSNLFIRHVLFILMYLHKCKMHVTMSVELKVYLFIWSHNFRFSMSLSLSPNYRLHRRWRFNEGALYIICNISPRFLCHPTAFFPQHAGAMGRQRALHTENSGFAAATLRRHISTFRGYQILFSIRNPYINRFTNHFSIHS